MLAFKIWYIVLIQNQIIQSIQDIEMINYDYDSSHTYDYVDNEYSDDPDPNFKNKYGGIPGNPGIPGVDGMDGKDGTPGSPGPRGHPGYCYAKYKTDYKRSVDVNLQPCPRGEKGNSGSPGYPGKRGLKGDVGLQGPPGAKGEKGILGLRGPPGKMGKPGAPGKSPPVQSAMTHRFPNTEELLEAMKQSEKNV